jgi:hypothetical protein
MVTAFGSGHHDTPETIRLGPTQALGAISALAVREDLALRRQTT